MSRVSWSHVSALALLSSAIAISGAHSADPSSTTRETTTRATTTTGTTTTTPQATAHRTTTTTAATTTSPAPTSFCHLLPRSVCQNTGGCYWCPIFGQGNNGTCHEVASDSQSSAPSFFCPYCRDVAAALRVSCLQLDDYRCTYCYSDQTCVIRAAQACASCSTAPNASQCAAYGGSQTLPGCQWCSLTSMCENPLNYQSNCLCSAQPRDTCLQFPSQCRYCQVWNTCQPADQPCETCANGTSANCGTGTGCSYCDVTFRCYNASGSYQCPASCAAISSETSCNSAGQCYFCPARNACIALFEPCEACSAYTSETSCATAPSQSQCNWCAFSNQCIEGVCPSSCAQMYGADSCNAISQCLYCQSTLSCVSSSSTCAACSSIISEDYCTTGCDWCYFTAQCVSASDWYCPAQCTSITRIDVCSAAPSCSWCLNLGSGSASSGTEACFQSTECTGALSNTPGLSGGAIAGIVFGAGGLFICLCACLCVACRRRRAASSAYVAMAGTNIPPGAAGAGNGAALLLRPATGYGATRVGGVPVVGTEIYIPAPSVQPNSASATVAPAASTPRVTETSSSTAEASTIAVVAGAAEAAN